MPSCAKNQSTSQLRMLSFGAVVAILLLLGGIPLAQGAPFGNSSQLPDTIFMKVDSQQLTSCQGVFNGSLCRNSIVLTKKGQKNVELGPWAIVDGTAKAGSFAVVNQAARVQVQRPGLYKIKTQLTTQLLLEEAGAAKDVVCDVTINGRAAFSGRSVSAGRPISCLAVSILRLRGGDVIGVHLRNLDDSLDKSQFRIQVFKPESTYLQVARTMDNANSVLADNITLRIAYERLESCQSKFYGNLCRDMDILSRAGKSSVTVAPWTPDSSSGNVADGAFSLADGGSTLVVLRPGLYHMTTQLVAQLVDASSVRTIECALHIDDSDPSSAARSLSVSRPLTCMTIGIRHLRAGARIRVSLTSLDGIRERQDQFRLHVCRKELTFLQVTRIGQ